MFATFAPTKRAYETLLKEIRTVFSLAGAWAMRCTAASSASSFCCTNASFTSPLKPRGMTT